MRTGTGEIANLRVFRIFDSMVTEERSSSVVLDRTCRRFRSCLRLERRVLGFVVEPL